MDIVDSTTRSRMMANIRSKNTKPELAVRRFLHANGFRFRLHQRNMPGTPDLVLAKWKVAIFVHGCFWHRHTSCSKATSPATNPEKWKLKFESNLARDRLVLDELKHAGWRVIIIWECGLGKNQAARLSWLPDAIRKQSRQFLEWPTQSPAVIGN